MVESLVHVLIASATVLACFGFGRLFMRRGGFAFESDAELVVFSVGAGFAILIYLLNVLGLIGLLYPQVAWAVLLAFAILGMLRLPWWRSLAVLGARLRTLACSRFAWIFALPLLLYGIGYLLTALSPTLEGDSLYGYLVLPREYARHHALVLVDYAYGTTYPQNGQMLSALGFLLQGQILAQLLVSFTMGLLCLAVIYAIGRTYLSRRAALVGMAIWYGTYSVAYLNASGKIDLAWAAFDLLALLAFGRWYFAQPGERHWRWLGLAGFFLGVAGGTKQATLFTMIALSLGILVRLIQARERRPAAWVATFAAFGMPASLAVLWVVRTYLITGGLGFAGRGLPGDKGAVGLLRTLWGMSMLGNAVSIEGPLGKSIGPTILATMPLLALLRNVERRVWHMLAFSGIMIVLWFQGVQRARHLLPTLAVLALVAGYVIVRLLAERRWFGQVVVAAMLLALTTNLGLRVYINLISIQRIPYVLGFHDRDHYLAVNLPKTKWYPNYPILRYVRDHLPPDARIAALSTGNSYYVERPFYAGWSQSPADDPNAEGLLQALKAQDITHVFVNDYVVERRNYRDAWLLQPEFQAQYLTKLICAEGQCLYAISSAPAGTAAK